MICDVENYAADIGDAVRTKLDKIYPRVRLPKELGGAEVDAIAWIWARTVRCPNPACGIEAPLTNKFWLSTHTKVTKRGLSQAFPLIGLQSRSKFAEGLAHPKGHN